MAPNIHVLQVESSDKADFEVAIKEIIDGF